MKEKFERKQECQTENENESFSRKEKKKKYFNPFFFLLLLKESSEHIERRKNCKVISNYCLEIFFAKVIPVIGTKFF